MSKEEKQQLNSFQGLGSALADKRVKLPEKPRDEKILYARGSDWDGFARFYNLVHPHLPLSEVEAKGGTYILPLRFVPGESVMYLYKPGKEGVVEAAVKFLAGFNVRGELHKDWVPFSQTPDWFKAALAERKRILEALGGDLTPWEDGLAGAIIKGQLKDLLRMAFMVFRHTSPGGRIEQAPFGATLVPIQEGVIKITKVFDPKNLFGVTEGEVLPQALFAQTRPDTLSHLVRTWAKLEGVCYRVLTNPPARRT